MVCLASTKTMKKAKPNQAKKPAKQKNWFVT